MNYRIAIAVVGTIQGAAFRQVIFFITLIYFLISNKDLLILKRERHPSTQGVYRGEHIKNEHYKNQVIQNRRKRMVSPHREPVQ